MCVCVMGVFDVVETLRRASAFRNDGKWCENACSRMIVCTHAARPLNKCNGSFDEYAHDNR